MGGWAALAQIAGTGLDGIMNFQSAQVANHHNIYNYKHRYQWQVKDMIAAGINPILAGNQGAGSLPGAPMAAESRIAQGLNNAVNTYNTGKAIEANITKTEADAKLANEKAITEQVIREKMGGEISNINADTQNKIAQLGVQNATVQKLNQEVTNLQQSKKESEERVYLYGAEIKNLNSRTDLTNEQKMNIIAERNKIEAEVQNIKQVTSNLGIQGAKAAKEIDEVVARTRSFVAQAELSKKQQGNVEQDTKLKEFQVKMFESLDKAVTEISGIEQAGQAGGLANRLIETLLRMMQGAILR